MPPPAIEIDLRPDFSDDGGPQLHCRFRMATPRARTTDAINILVLKESTASYAFDTQELIDQQLQGVCEFTPLLHSHELFGGLVQGIAHQRTHGLSQDILLLTSPDLETTRHRECKLNDCL